MRGGRSSRRTCRLNTGLLRGLIAATAVSALVSIACDPVAHPETEPANLIFNGDFSITDHKRPLGWYVIKAPESSVVTVERPKGEPPALVVENTAPQVAGVEQSLDRALPPGPSWGGSYELTVLVKTEGLRPQDHGAAITLATDISPVHPLFEVNSHGHWRLLDVCIGSLPSSDFKWIRCTLGHEGSPSVGKAFFRTLRLVLAPDCANSTAARVGLNGDFYFTGTSEPLSAHPQEELLGLGVAVAILAASAIAGWRRLTRRGAAERPS
jgi:hypothetical protein